MKTSCCSVWLRELLFFADGSNGRLCSQRYTRYTFPSTGDLSYVLYRGASAFALSFFRYVYDNSELQQDDDVPLKLFWEGNQTRVYDHIHEVRQQLRKAQKVSLRSRVGLRERWYAWLREEVAL